MQSVLDHHVTTDLFDETADDLAEDFATHRLPPPDVPPTLAIDERYILYDLLQVRKLID